MQDAIPHLFKAIPDSFFAEAIATYEGNAQACYDILCQVEGIRPIKPSAPMHMMVCVCVCVCVHVCVALCTHACVMYMVLILWQVDLDLSKFPEFEDDISLVKQLIIDQGVMCLPGSVSDCG